MQADTFAPTAQGTQAWDRFSYINNNPVNGTDPSGHKACMVTPDGCGDFEEGGIASWCRLTSAGVGKVYNRLV
jgi:hypothetical protein